MAQIQYFHYHNKVTTNVRVMLLVRGRFAPTPSGFMHIGNLMTALLAWLQVRKAGGQFVLRMEDIDKPRSRPQLAKQIVDDLRWFGIDWDEGPDVGGTYGPYTQSLREGLYKEALQKLSNDGWLYPCYCSRADLLALASAPHGLESEGPAYPGTCKALTEAERSQKALSKQPSLRFAMPDKPFALHDGVAGKQQVPAGKGGDFVVKRADGVIAYQLAVVVDDAAMEMTDVLRGWDLLDSTPRQLALYEALRLPVPRFAHVPLLLGPDGSRLSKRHGSLAAASIRENGIAPERIVGRIACKMSLINRPEPLRPTDLISEFQLHKIPKHPIKLSVSDIQSLTGSV